MGLLDILPFGSWKNLLPNDFKTVNEGGPSVKEIPQLKIDFRGPFNEKRLIGEIVDYMQTKRWVFGEFVVFEKGPEHNHILRGFRRMTDYYKCYCDVRIKVHWWKPSGLKDKPDSGFVRIWVGEKKWELKKDFQGKYQENARIWGIRNFFDKYFFRREFDTQIIPAIISDIYGVAAVARKELGIECISYEEGLKRTKTWN